MLNSVNVVGRITKNPEIKFIGTENTPVCNFGVAVNRPYKNKETNEYEADFFNCAAFGKTAEFLGSYVKKGNLIGVTGHLTTRQYDKEGQTHYVVEIKAEKVLSYSPKSESTDQPVIKESAADVKKAMNAEFLKMSVGLDKEAKDNLLKEIYKKFRTRLNAAGNDLPF